MGNENRNKIFESIVELLELPDSAYEKAISRYEDLGAWLLRKESESYPFDPKVFSQGSFRFGTAIRPLNDKEKYDLDLTCKLQKGISKRTHTQKKLKEMLGKDIESYRQARGIQEEKEEKHRCWRLNYADELSFHMDIVPCIPEEDYRRVILNEKIVNGGIEKVLAGQLSALTVSITDDEHAAYLKISDDWPISNPEGYALWFQSRMRLAQSLLIERAKIYNAASIDKVPVYRWKTPLQRSVQLLKRHRDQMFRKNCELKPISMIITTLAARAYGGEADLKTALGNIVNKMQTHVRLTKPFVPNPVDPGEDFADKWSKPGGQVLRDNFNAWVDQVKADFGTIDTSNDPDLVLGKAEKGFEVKINEKWLKEQLGLTAAKVEAPSIHVLRETSKPWQQER